MTQVIKNEEKDRYEVIVDEDVVAGFADYHVVDGYVSMPHTEVLPEHEDKGLGTALVKGALADIKLQRYYVLPICPFVAAYIRQHPEYLDLVPQDQRAAFGL